MSSIDHISGQVGLARPDASTEQTQAKERANAENGTRVDTTDAADSVNVRSMMAPPSETLDEESAAEAVQRIQDAGTHELAAAHNALDPDRVYRLLGLLG